jgi:6-phosphogluconate dehydrogenase
MSITIGLVGLGVMGRNLALNMAGRGHQVACFDIDEDQRRRAQSLFFDKSASVVASLAELAGCLEPPRMVLIMVPAGEPVDSVIGELRPLLAEGDTVMDGGNSFFLDTERRTDELEQSGIRYLGVGISGGEKGALLGPSIMVGGSRSAYRFVEPVLLSITARTEDGPCCSLLGSAGAGHYVKMVHNGIEYGLMQLICEAYDLLKTGLEMSSPELHKVFSAWNEGPLNSFLVEVTATVLAKIDERTGKRLVDLVVDTAGQKGTGRWASQSALNLNVAIPTVNAAVEARLLSAIKSERLRASKVLGPEPRPHEGDRAELLDVTHDALHLAILATFAQGFALLREASREYGLGLDLEEIARIWKGGCVIRAQLLDEIKRAFSTDLELPNLLLDEALAERVRDLRPALGKLVGSASNLGIGCPAFAASLAYLDTYRRQRLPANLLQAQRDCVGAHTYERLDQPAGRSFHSEW